MSTFRVKKIVFDVAPSQPQQYTLKFRRTQDPDTDDSYTIYSDSVLALTSGNIAVPVQIDTLDDNVSYTFRWINNADNSSTDEVYVTPYKVNHAPIPLDDEYQEGSEIVFITGGAFLDAQMIDHNGHMCTLSEVYADAFGNYAGLVPNAGTPPAFAKVDNRVGVHIANNGEYLQYPESGAGSIDQAGVINGGKYTFSFWLWIAAADLAGGGKYLVRCLDGTDVGGMKITIDSDGYIHYTRYDINEAHGEDCVTGSPINFSTWNQFTLSVDVHTVHMWLNQVDNHTGTISADTDYVAHAGQKVILFADVAPGGYLSNTKGYYRWLHFRADSIDINTMGKLQAIPAVVGVIKEDVTNVEFLIDYPNCVAMRNDKVVFHVPSNAPFDAVNQLRYFVRTNSGDRASRPIKLKRFAKRTTSLVLDFDNAPADALAAVSTQFYALSKAWGGYANGGVSPNHITVETESDGSSFLTLESHGDTYAGTSQGYNKDGTLKVHTIQDDPDWGSDPRLGLPWIRRTGACLITKDYFGFGEYKVKFRLRAHPDGTNFQTGVVPSFWTFHYEEGYLADAFCDEIIADGMKREGGMGDGYYWVRNHEIDMEQPSHLDGGTYNMPSFNHFKGNTWKGETGDGSGTDDGGTYQAKLTDLGFYTNDNAWHEYKMKWYHNRVEHWWDGVLKQTNLLWIPDIPGRFTLAQWFPSGTASDGSVAPWLPKPASEWGGVGAAFDYQKLDIALIQITPYDDATAGGSNRLRGETYPVAGSSYLSAP